MIACSNRNTARLINIEKKETMFQTPGKQLELTGVYYNGAIKLSK